MQGHRVLRLDHKNETEQYRNAPGNQVRQAVFPTRFHGVILTSQYLFMVFCSTSDPHKA